MNSRSLPTGIPSYAYKIDFSYNNLDKFCGLTRIGKDPLLLKNWQSWNCKPANKKKVIIELNGVKVIDFPEILENVTLKDLPDGADVVTMPLPLDTDFGKCDFPCDLRACDYPSAVSNLDYYENLVSIDLTHNPLNELCNYSFNMARNLTYLTISDTHLTNLKNKTFANLSKLEELELTRNKITEMENGTFSNLDSLLRLNMANGRLNFLPNRLFENSSSVEYVYFTNNKISRIFKETFSGMENLLDLDLSKNQLSLIPEYSFEDLNSLKNLWAATNKITQITENTLKGLTELETLDFQQNKISFVDEKAFVGMRKLKIVGLMNNEIKLIYPRWFEAGVLSSNNQAFFGLSSNQWYCGCDATPFKLWLEANGTTTIQTEEGNNKDYFFRISQIKREVGLPCYTPTHLRVNDMKLDEMPLEWFPGPVDDKIEETEEKSNKTVEAVPDPVENTCRPPDKPRKVQTVSKVSQF